MRDFLIAVVIGAVLLIGLFLANQYGASKVQDYLDAVEQAE